MTRSAGDSPRRRPRRGHQPNHRVGEARMVARDEALRRSHCFQVRCERNPFRLARNRSDAVSIFRLISERHGYLSIDPQRIQLTTMTGRPAMAHVKPRMRLMAVRLIGDEGSLHR